MPYSQYTSIPFDKVLDKFKVDLHTGLSSKDVVSNTKLYGSNILKSKETSWYKLFLRQFKSAFVYLLFACSVLAFFLGEKLDSILIIIFILTNSILGFIQEYRSEKTLRLLKKYITKKTKVLRDGIEVIINSDDVVSGDIVILKAGDVVPADIRIIKSSDLYVDESSLTGESVPIKKSSEIIEVINPDSSSDSNSNSDSNLPIYKATNILFSGTNIVEGNCIGVVFEVGNNTQMGKILKLSIETTSLSGFEKQINKFSKFILYLTLITLVIVFLVQIFFINNISIPDLIIFSIALAVGVVPEAMPLVTTFSLSQGASRLAKKKVVVKRLSSIEDLGSIEILCTDKTGTLTENSLSVSDIYSKNKDKTLLYGLLASSFVENEDLSTKSFDKALIDSVKDSLDAELKSSRKIKDIPFSPSRRRNSVLVDVELSGNQQRVLIVRGAFESLLPYTNISQEKLSNYQSWIISQEEMGKRVLAIFSRLFDKDTYENSDEETNLEFEGLISFEDPIKESTRGAVDMAEKLGITVKVLTGDSPKVAGYVSMSVGISDNQDDVITGEEFERLDESDKKDILEKYNVFARVSPLQKYNIIKLLREKYEVGYMGEGINDAPALKIASVGIVVDNASDISKEVADVVLLKRSLSTIIDGIKEGRRTFVNTTKYIKSTLVSNFGNFYAMAFATLVIDFLPMLPIQILLVNLLSDFPMISVATDNVDSSDLKSPHNYNIKEITLIATILGLISTLFDFIMFGIFSKLGPGHLRTYWFMGSIITELILVFSIRTNKLFIKAEKLPSRELGILSVFAIFLTMLIPFTKIGEEVFGFIKPTSNYMLLIGFIVLTYFIMTEAGKLIYFKYFDSKSETIS